MDAKLGQVVKRDEGRAAGAPMCLLLALLVAGPALAAPEADLAVRIVLDEADAALAILDLGRDGHAVPEAAWQRLFASEGFVRLKKRQESFGASGVEAAMREYLLAGETRERAAALRASVESWRSRDATAAARRAAAYLPQGTPLRATVYPVIKRSDNSFVFELKTAPAIFFYVGGGENPAALENTMAHELHHVGLAGCGKPADWAALSPAQQRAVEWLGALGEGLATLAAAGGPERHPHAEDEGAAWVVWERDVASFERDRAALEQFFLAVLNGALAEEELRRRLFTFINTDDVPQGAFYTVGWKMAALVERAFGRQRLLAGICDPRRLLADYNEVARGNPRADGGGLSLWSAEFLARLQSPPRAPRPSLAPPGPVLAG